MNFLLGDTAPDFHAVTTVGETDFYDFLGSSWGVLFSHPADFTPVCTTELGAVGKLKNEFARRKVKVLALSVDPVESHLEWIKDIESTQNTIIDFPIIADPDLRISRLFGFVHPSASDKFTVRSLVILDPNKKVRLTITYPASTGRNFDEVLRVIDSLQLTETKKVATPADWKKGGEVVVLPSIPSNEIPSQFGKPFREVLPYLRMIDLNEKERG